MKLSKQNLAELCEIAITAAKAAGQLITQYAQQSVKVDHKPGANSLAASVVTKVDLECETLIINHLESTLERFDLALLSEEREDDGQRLHKNYFWCIDPLDGTLAFSRGQAGYAVSIALVSQDGVPQIGVVYDPTHDSIYSAIKGHGAFRNGHSWRIGQCCTTDRLTLPCDHSLIARVNFSEFLQTFKTKAHAHGFNEVCIKQNAGAVMNAINVIEHAPACYFKAPKPQDGGGSLWDFAATACLFNELGAVVCDFNGNALELNRKESTFMNHRGIIYSSHTKLIEVVRDSLNEHPVTFSK